jgi:serine phosphatase RsbU (regulator of sigma subunit)
VLFYSDGISEALNEAQEEYGTVRLSEMLGQPRISAEAILDDLRDHSAGQPAFDDATVVLIARR